MRGGGSGGVKSVASSDSAFAVALPVGGDGSGAAVASSAFDVLVGGGGSGAAFASSAAAEPVGGGKGSP